MPLRVLASFVAFMRQGRRLVTNENIIILELARDVIKLCLVI